MKGFSIILLLFLVCFAADCQIPNWQEINIEDARKIGRLNTDTLGFLWMTDDENLYRFDGVTLTKEFGFEDEKISNLGINNTGLLVCTEYGRILRCNPYKFSHSLLFESDDYAKVTGVAYKNEEEYLIYSYGKGVKIVSGGNSFQFNKESGLLSNEVYDALFQDGQYYLATDQGIQIIKMTGQKPSLQSILFEDGLTDLIITNLISYDSKIWYSDYDQNIGCLVEDLPSCKYKLPQKSTIKKLLSHKSGLYVATDVGVFRFAYDTWVKIYPYEGDEKIIDIEIDEEDNFWLINSEHALIRGNLVFQKVRVPLNSLQTVVKFKGSYLVGDENGFYSFANKNLEQLNLENVTHILVEDDYLILGTMSNGIKVYNKRLELVESINEWHGIENQSVLYMAYSGGYLYASSLSGVMKFSFKEGNISPVQSLNSVVGSEYIYSILLDGNYIYFGTDRSGLIKWDQGKDVIQPFKKLRDGKKLGSVYSMTKDSDGKIWFTTSNLGIGLLVRNEIVILSKIKNKVDEYTSLEYLSNGSLLAVRGESVDLIDPRTHHIMYYDKEIGIVKEKAYLNNIKSGDLATYFVHNGDVYQYSGRANCKIHPEVIIEEVLVNLTPIKDKVSFSEDENNIEFKFSGSWLTDPSKLSYQYKLEGLEEEWRTTKDNTVAFPKLQPGNYNFRLRASENGLFTNEPDKNFSFTIRRHFFNKWWVRALGISLLCYLAFLVFKFIETRKKDKLALEKLNIENQFVNLKNQLNPHFLFNAFNTLIGLIEEDSERSVEFVERMTSFYRNILDFGKRDIILLESELEMLKQYMDILKARFADQLDIQLSFEDDLSHYSIPPMTLQLLMENAVKHNVVSTKTPLKISFTQIGNTITVLNNKSPLLKEVKSTKLGLLNIAKRFKLLGLKEPKIIQSDNTFEVVLHIKYDKN